MFHRPWLQINCTIKFFRYNPRSNFGLEIIDDMILAIGGFNGSVTISHCECYVPETNEWLEATDMSIIRSALTANVVHGLPNLHDYIHKERNKLVEERRVNTFGIGEGTYGWNHRHLHNSDYFVLPIDFAADDSDDNDVE